MPSASFCLLASPVLPFLLGIYGFPEVYADKRFVPNCPRVVPGRNRTHIARAELCLGTVVHSNHDLPRDDMDEVANLATVGPNNRSDTLRPAPSRLICHTHRLDNT